MLYSTFFPEAFPALALAHFVALLSPGQDFFLIIGHSIRHRLKGSRFICLGIALGNAIYIAIAILGWTRIRDNNSLFMIISMLGAAYLFWIGIHLLKSQKNEDRLEIQETLTPSAFKQLTLGLNSALLNPKNALFYMSLMVVILGNSITITQQITCGVWMSLAVLLWDLLVASVIGLHQVQMRLSQSVHLIERGAGMVLIFFGMALFVDYLR
ncbi:LysE family translocator [Vibrio porteresiae]|uniref:LysE family translocator n=1 Tax=Vibrio porteresiae DSM 19223 TaxID=1123496 RepID=A0ABZ0QIE7_9VIBR|nr:LysE family translocator [Vibrio porteresiae]WPC76273.1 LysE family translocator [Vibrio porteresiae DSM 19223]